jgi:hypothetical protein
LKDSSKETNEVLRLTLSEAINQAVRYNLGAIESDENTRAARGQRLLALSHLLPQVSAGINENVDQVNLTALGLGAVKIPGTPAVVGPFSYSTASASLSQTLFSYESIQRFRAARTSEQAAQLSYKDTLDVITLTVGNAYLQVIEASSRIEAEEAQVQNAKALYDQATDEFQAGTRPRLGAALFSSTVLMPQLLQTLMGYTAQKAGMVLSAGALVVLVVLPMVGKLTTRFQARHIIACGWIGLAAAMYISSKQIDLLMSFRSATLLRVWQYIPVAFLFVPLTLAGYVGLAPEKTNAAAGLMNFFRNMGQSVGTSAVTTLIARRSQYHQSVLTEYTASGRFHSSITVLAIRLTRSGLSAHAAQQQALGRLYAVVQAQAAVLSYIDVYWLLAMGSAIMFVASFLLKRNEPGKSAKVSVH